MARVLTRLERHGDVERLHVAHAPLGTPIYWVSVYRRGDVLVDTGCAWGRSAVEAFLRERPPRVVLTTHEHEDHVGNHEILPPTAEVYAPRAARLMLERGPPRLPLYRFLAWGSHGRASGVREAPKRVHVGGRSFVALPAPGHSADHVVWLDEEGSAVFTGDAYLGKLRAVRAKEDVPLQMRSLRRVADLDPETLFPAHGPVLHRPRAALLDVVEHFDRLAARAKSLAERGFGPRKIRQDLLGPEPALAWWSLGAFSAENLVRSLVRG